MLFFCLDSFRVYREQCHILCDILRQRIASKSFCSRSAQEAEEITLGYLGPIQFELANS